MLDAIEIAKHMVKTGLDYNPTLLSYELKITTDEARAMLAAIAMSPHCKVAQRPHPSNRITVLSVGNDAHTHAALWGVALFNRPLQISLDT